MGLSSRSSGGHYPAPVSSSGTGTPCNRQTSAQNLKGRNARDTLSKQASNVGATFEDFDYVAVNVAARSVDLVITSNDIIAEDGRAWFIIEYKFKMKWVFGFF